MTSSCARRILLAAAVALATAAPSPTSAAETRKPNIIFILADDLGWGDLGCYGHPHIKSPSLDRLAKQGTLFTQFYVNGSVCSPSRCAFMTSQYPARQAIHGHYATREQNEQRGMSNWLDPKAPNVASVLKSAGYATGHFGKWHLGAGPGAPEPGAYGIDDYRVMNGNGPTWDLPPRDFWARSSTLIVGEAIRFIRTNQARPFYLNVWSLLPHATLNPTDQQMRPYARFAPAHGVPHKSAAQIYYASVTDLDTQVGRLLAEVDKLGLADHTLVLFSSDNGPEDIHIPNAGHSGIGSAGPFRGRKRSLYEGGVRTPFIARWPGRIPTGRVDNTSVVAGVDVLPTLCKLAGAPLPAGLKPDGEDVGDILCGQARPRALPLFWEWRFGIVGEPFHRSPILAVREGDWKLLLNPDRSRIELYDIPRDPTELANAAKDHPDVVDRLAAKALAWQATLPKGPIESAAGKANYPWPSQREGPER
ncbi:MAG TPA: sulfatase-like hydrolase/transferase [Candidatus Paceibacterota bacterium]|nr:sulfatase-like hydrolase/transferase [Candidatus Paceibacterota bacterium]